MLWAAFDKLGVADDSFRCEMGRQADLLLANIDATQRAIREEATINRVSVANIPTSPNDPYRFTIGASVTFDDITKEMFRDTWDDGFWNKMKKMIETLLSPEGGKTDDPVRTVAELQKSLVCALIQPIISPKTESFNEGDYARAKGACLASFAPGYEKLLSLLLLLTDCAYLQLRRAEFLIHSHPAAGSGGREHAWKALVVRKAWRRVCQLCNLVIDWCKHLPVEVLAVEMGLKVRLHCFYAVALANLDRFYEANRHINEATGINSKWESALPQVEMAKLRLRRAEIFLTEAHRLSLVMKTIVRGIPEQRNNALLDIRDRVAETWYVNSPRSVPSGQNSEDGPWVCIHPAWLGLLPLSDKGSSKGSTRSEVKACLQDLARALVVTLDDAWAQLTYAEKSLSGHRQSNLWWGRLAVMKLRAFSYQAPVAGELK